MPRTTAGEWSTTVPGGGALVGIWGGVVAMSLFAPDLVSGSEHEHLPIAALTTWIWGVVASRAVLTTLVRLSDARSDQLRGQLVGFIAGVWAVAALVAILAPEMVTGSDPTRLPIAALLAPMAATALTTGACEMAAAFVARAGRESYPAGCSSQR
ncbi:MAG TPA: hypothetical protein VHF27_00360 [Acidimicrobiales bacterium]|nr:hypothetical protein [Acidimicrobiales bacterium]